MRGLIFGLAAACYVAALAIAAAGLRVSATQPTRAVADAPALPAPPPLIPPPVSQPDPGPLAAAEPQHLDSQLQATVDDLAREQDASRRLVTELRASVAQLRGELARRGSAPPADVPQARTVAVICCDLLPPGRETLDARIRGVVRSVLAVILADPKAVVSVEGHTDSRPIRIPAGKPFKDNAELSLLRARAVAALLQQQGVPAGRIRVKAWGDTRPLATNDTADGRDRNRRVEILLLAPSSLE